MSDGNAAVAVFNTYEQAEAALTQLHNAGFDLEKLSIVGRHRRDGEAESLARVSHAGGESRSPGAAFAAGWSRLLCGWASFFVPDVGEIFVAGPLATWMITALENASIFGELSVLGAGLYMAGVRKSRALRYEAALTGHNCLVVAHGSEDEIALAKRVLRNSGPVEPLI